MDQTAVTVAAVHNVGPDAIAVEFETPDGFDARPGQFVKLVVTVDGEEEPRFYTISSPDVAETFEITIGIDPEGAVTPRLRTLAAGDELTLSGPYGDAYYEGEQRVLVLAGGPGIGPAVGIAERAVEDGGAAALVYRDDEPIHEDRLADLGARGVDIEILTPAETLDDAVADALSAETQVFVYGFAEFLDDATSALEAVGADPEAAKVENFG
ncbi:FAD-dependent oxidoreductase [Salinibaculum rarum]|uniref:FAD-dependent oxidoreductase n=1 Tax=Salinibaculum rarum TaxID=3058903 RepID=UPI00265E7F62|nr:FAD-dependent oxidoreductase [Salinibaculum sp. KK48]